MPHIVLQLSGERDSDLMRKAVKTINDLTAEVLGKDRAVMATAIQFIPSDQWFIGGVALDETGGSAFHLDISITDETNTKAEKSRYLQEVFKALSALRPDLHQESYVHLIDARAAAYGYGGRTQEWRHQHP